MWETILSKKYGNFVLNDDDIAYYKVLSDKFENELGDYNKSLLNSSLCGDEIPDGQSVDKVNHQDGLMSECTE